MQLTTYGKLSALEYALSNEEPPEDAFAFYYQQYEAGLGPVLESMCGAGRFLIPFLQRGMDIDGMDASTSWQNNGIHCQIVTGKVGVCQRR